MSPGGSPIFRTIISLGVLVSPLLSPARAAEPAPADKQLVEVKFWVVEISTTKLRNLGFDWQALERSEKMDDDSKKLGFLLALETNNLARVAGSPTVTSLSGRSASLTLRPEFKLDVTPKIIDERTIELSYRIDKDLAQTGQPERRLVNAYSTEVEEGVVTCLCQTKARSRDSEGKVTEKTMLVIAKATTLK